MSICNEDNFFTISCNQQLLENEWNKTHEIITLNQPDALVYPDMNDPAFNIKIAQKSEFNETRYDGTLHNDIEEQANQLANAKYQLQGHQAFVRNYLSGITPYTSLLLFHGVGTGKTCTAIGVCEEMRDLMKQTGLVKSMLIVASTNVQENFRQQLFDESRLEEKDGKWTMTGCIEDKLLNEIKSTNVTKEEIIGLVNELIDKYYTFMDYNQLAQYIVSTTQLRTEFDNRLIVIDEVHNIYNDNKVLAEALDMLVKTARGIRMLLLSATPMYNSYKEIVWLLNLMNTNDRRARVRVGDIFHPNGSFKEKGEELLMRKATGYVSFVRGENPYTFPFRVYPKQFAPQQTFSEHLPYPQYQFDLKLIDAESRHRKLSLFLTNIGCQEGCGKCQYCCYRYIVHQMRAYKNNMFVLQIAIQTLLMAFPFHGLKNIVKSLPRDIYSKEFAPKLNEVIQDVDETMTMTPGTDLDYAVYGLQGLKRLMTFDESTRTNFAYKTSTLREYGRIFSRNKIGNFSAKIQSVLDNIQNPHTGVVSKGVVLVYSEYIDAGLFPMALALEEMGFMRHGGPSLFHASSHQMDNNVVHAKYVLLTETDNQEEIIRTITHENNQEGHDVKVILLSRAASEGIDFKFIRQVHILDPWFNMNRIEQVIGRAVRNFSHKSLPFEERNVEIFLHATLLPHNKEEAADLYLYRFAELKAIQIGKITRVLKESAVDCIINHDQTNFTQAKMNQTIKQVVSTGQVLPHFKVGDAPFSPACDYMATCDFNCRPTADIHEDKSDEDTYDISYVDANIQKIQQKIRLLFKEEYFYNKQHLLNAINIPKEYPSLQIHLALTNLLKNPLEDKYGRPGRLVDIGNYYFFQPTE